MKIYVAGPLNASDAAGFLKNVSRMCYICNEIRKMGHSPFNPSADLLIGIIDGKMEYQDYLQMNLPWVEVADALFLIDYSPGANKELEIAEKKGISIYRDLTEIPVKKVEEK